MGRETPEQMPRLGKRDRDQMRYDESLAKQAPKKEIPRGTAREEAEFIATDKGDLLQSLETKPIAEHALPARIIRGTPAPDAYAEDVALGAAYEGLGFSPDEAGKKVDSFRDEQTSLDRPKRNAA